MRFGCDKLAALLLGGGVWVTGGTFSMSSASAAVAARIMADRRRCEASSGIFLSSGGAKASLIRQCGVTAGEEGQRRTVPVREALDPPDEDHVVASLLLAGGDAFQMRQTSGQQGQATQAPTPAGAGEPVFARRREAGGQLVLVLGQDVHGEAAGGAEGGKVAERFDRLHRISGGSSDTM